MANIFLKSRRWCTHTSSALGILILGESHLTEEFKGVHTKKEIIIDLDLEGWDGFEKTLQKKKKGNP